MNSIHNQPFVSVIVPVFNVEKYIERTVSSIIHQDYKNIEIILINDGSTDNSLSILNRLSEEDSRIKVYNKQNGGVSSTRNYGINVSRGDYIVFVDGDDWIDSQHISVLVDACLKYNAQMAIGTKHFFDEGVPSENNDKSSKDCLCSSNKIIRDIYYNKIYMAVWNKIYKKSFLVKNNILFDESIWYAEGMHFNVQCLSSLEKVPVCSFKTYHYVTNPDSAMRKEFSLRNEECALTSLKKQEQIVQNNDRLVKTALHFHIAQVHRNIIVGEAKNHLLNKTSKNYKKSNEYQIAKKSIKKMRSLFLDVLFANLSLKSKVEWLLFCMFPILEANRIASKLLGSNNVHL